MLVFELFLKINPGLTMPTAASTHKSDENPLVISRAVEEFYRGPCMVPAGCKRPEIEQRYKEAQMAG